MANYNWISTSSGSWATAADWSGGVVPTIDDNAAIDVAGITVNITSGLSQAYTLTTVGAELLVNGGTLQTAANAILDGLFDESSGLFLAGGAGVTFEQALELTGGTIHVQAGGSIQIDDGATLAGALTGNGTLVVGGGSTYINAGFSDTLHSIVVDDGGKVGLDISLKVANDLSVLQNSVLDLFGNTLTTTGNVELEGTLGGGSLIQTGGTIVLGSPAGQVAVLDNSLVVTINDILEQDGSVSFGANDSGAKLTVSKTGQYFINGNWSILDPSTTGSIVNQGVFAKSGGGKTAVVNTSFNSSGTVRTAVGVLLLNGIYNTLTGTVSGAGTLGIAGDQTNFGTGLALSMGALDQQSGLLVLNSALTYHNEWDMTGGVLNLNSKATTLTLSNNGSLASSHFNFDGGLITGYGGTIVIDGQAQFGGTGASTTVGGLTTLTINGRVNQTASINFGLSSNPVANITAGGVWVDEGDSAITGVFGEINNAGTFLDRNGSGIAVVQSTFNNTGTLTVNNSALQLAGAGTLGGVLNGTGILDIAGDFYISSATTVSVASLNIDNGDLLVTSTVADARAFSESGGQALLDIAGGTSLSLSGTTSLDSGALTDNGALVASGATTIGPYLIEGGATLEVTASAEQTGTLNFNGGLLSIAAGATYKIADDLSIATIGTAGAEVENQGTLVALGTGTVDNISVAFGQGTTGTLNVYSTALELSGGGALSGHIIGSGTLQLTNGTFDIGLGAALVTTVSSFQVLQTSVVSLFANESYAGYWDETSANSTINLNSETLSLSGTTQLVNATLAGSGVVTTSNSTTLNNVTINGSTLALTGSSEQIGVVSLNSGDLTIAKTAVYAFDAGSLISGIGTLGVTGTLAALGDGLATINVTTIADAGTISAALGTLSVSGTVTGTGSFSIGGTGAFLDFTNTGTISATNTVGFAAGSSGGDLIIGDPNTFAAIIGGFTAGDIIELPNFQSTTVTGSLSTNGLDFAISDKSGDQITLVFSQAQTAGSIYLGTSSADNNVIVLHH